MKNKLMQLVKDNAQKDRPALRAEAAADGIHVYVYDVIDSFWGASASDLLEALSGAGDTTIHLHINSPGGDVFEARAMAAAIVGCPNNVVTHIDGVCASAATYLALSGNEVRMTDGGLFMVHNSWTMAMGDCNELRQTADLLQKIDGTINSDYAKKTCATPEQVKAWMDAETWFTAQEALDAGFIDAIDANSKQDAPTDKWNLSAYANAPAPQVAAAPDDISESVARQVQLNQNRMRLVAQKRI